MTGVNSGVIEPLQPFSNTLTPFAFIFLLTYAAAFILIVPNSLSQAVIPTKTMSSVVPVMPPIILFNGLPLKIFLCRCDQRLYSAANVLKCL